MVCLLREWKLVLVLKHEITYFRYTNRKTAIYASSLAKGFHVHSLPHKLCHWEKEWIDYSWLAKMSVNF